ncbi:MAG: 4-hydroxy-tetrahydrodipicolinate synthase [Gammaproteobacteria bacterium]
MFQGSMVALVTPMRRDGSVDEASLKQLIEWHIESGTEAIVAVGTTGESATLNHSEHCDVIAQVVAHVNHRIPVIAGTGANATREAIELTGCAKAGGADACLLVAPYYNKPTQEGLYLHYKAVAEAVPIPQILYNVPGRTACDVLPETVIRLSRIPNIVGIKEATDLARMRLLLERVDAAFAIYSGDDSMAMEAILSGARGVISVTANVAPKLMHEMCARALCGDRAGATALNDRLVPLHEALFVESNPIPVKWALHTMNLIPPGIRLPLTTLSEPNRLRVKTALQMAGLFSA